ncbi:SCP2 sterol-binding domain-containing protein [Roseovarius nanhaiticus]|uniref:SCP2 sterol-binding domain-containing protein n=1 Tax=Roseovarius nanhaiticus TaxID=573024 RepID=UPI00248F6656|nr:SCP2 sterol-binding domain-containing protein [Roseovarius nanhaiticus]
MSDRINEAVEALNRRLKPEGMDGMAKFVVTGEGIIVIDANGARPGKDADDANVTLTATADVFEDIVRGDLDPAKAYLTGKMGLKGDIGAAMKLGRILG